MLSGPLPLWGITALTTLGVLLRPFRLPEAVWACGGAALVVLLGLLPAADALHAIGEGGDVYLFLVGMMLLSETARREGVFDWVAGHAVNRARGSRERLFVLVYAVGTVVTVFLSNDATAVVLTPAVFAVARRARTPALPCLFACAFVANAASFVLPISNPANLVLYGAQVPALLPWLQRFALPSLLAIVATFVALRLTQRRALQGGCEPRVEIEPLAAGGRTALAGLLSTAVVLLAVSAFDRPLGLPTCTMGALTAAAVLLRGRTGPGPLLRGIAWSVLPLVGGLFVLVEALNHAGVVAALVRTLTAAVQADGHAAAATAAAVVALGANVVNNLPAGLLVATTVQQAQPPTAVVDALLIGIDLGPNLSITGSLATLLWLAAIRREGEDVGFLRFLKVGVVVMPPALLLALAARLLVGG